MALGDKLPVVMGKEKAVAGGVATLGPDGVLSEEQRPSVDAVPTEGSSSPVQSGGVYSALSNKAAMIDHGGESTDALGPLADGIHRGITWESLPAEAQDKQGYILAEDYAVSDGVVQWGRRTFTSPHDGVIWINSCVVGTWLGWKMLATATSPQAYDLPLAEGITNIDGTTSKYWIDQESTVHVELSIQSASELADESLVATLPEGFLPAKSQPRYIGNDAFLTAQTGGEIQLFLRGGGSLPAGKWICVEFNYEANLQT